jgi:hypothetical protein
MRSVAVLKVLILDNCANFVKRGAGRMPLTPGGASRQSRGFEARGGAGGYTALMNACCCGNVEAVDALMRLGADAALKNDEGEDAESIARRDDPYNWCQLICADVVSAWKERVDLGEVLDGARPEASRRSQIKAL